MTKLVVNCENGTVEEVELTEEDLSNLPSKEELAKYETEAKVQEALAKIATLEASQLRSIRELMLDPTNAYAKEKLEDIEAQIQAERLKL